MSTGVGCCGLNCTSALSVTTAPLKADVQMQHCISESYLFYHRDIRTVSCLSDNAVEIIITNEKIKVMLLRKRCRGTLQDYKMGSHSELPNR